MTAPSIVIELVERFKRNENVYRSAGYNETQVRREFIDPLFEALGWDVGNRQGYAEQWKEVVHEDALKVAGATKAPDYSFRLGGRRLFFLEAKRPGINLKDDPEPAYQLRRYAWTAKLPLSILTDFEEFIVYDTRVRPAQADKAAKARLLYITCDEYEARWDELVSIFSPDAIRKGSFDKYVESATGKRGTAEVDDAFLAEIEQWRNVLARNIALRNPTVSQRELNFAVQRTIDRIIFLRICEDRGMEHYGQLQALLNGQQVYSRMREMFALADNRYNSGLFHFKREKSRPDPPDELTPRLAIDDKVLQGILKRLYYPESPYEFSVMPAEVLGQVYERFLGSVIRLTAGHRAVVEQKPEVRKAGGVYYTPSYIVDYIVKQTVGKLLEGKTPQEIAGLTDSWRPSKTRRPLGVVDPACGSGSFLLGAFQYLLNWHLEQYSKEPEMWLKGNRPCLFKDRRGTLRLTTLERKRILLANIYGVDIDPQAVEVTKLSLLLKVLEDENAETLKQQLKLFHERALPDLAGNIKCGNSLIGSDFYVGRQASMFDEDEIYRINAFDWNAEFAEVMQAGGFDAVIGNPPYVRIQTLKESAPVEVDAYKNGYKSASSGNYDIYVVFVEKGLSLLNSEGRLGFILPHKFFTTDYGERLRALLTIGKHLSGIIDFGHAQVFAGATTYTCLLLLTASASDSFTYAALQNPSLVGQQDYAQVAIPSSQISGKPWAFRSDSAELIVQKLHRQSVALLDIPCFISRGSSTGADDVFVLRRTDGKLLTQDGYEVKPEDGIVRTPIYATDFGRYTFLPNSGQAVIFPYSLTARGYSLIDEDNLRKRFPKTYDYLVKSRSRLKKRKQFKTWYGFSAPRNLAKHESASLLIPLLAERGSACHVSDIKGQYCLMASAGFSVTPNPSSGLSSYYILALLNSSLLFWLLRSLSNKFRGGWITCTKQYVGTLPIRALDTSDPQHCARHDRIVSLVQRMLNLNKLLRAARTDHDQNLIKRQIAATDQEIDRLVYELYDLTDEEIAIVEGATFPQ